MKAKVNLGLRRLSVPDKIEKGRTIVTSMAASASFTAPSPDLATVTTAIDDLDTAWQAAETGGKAQRLIMLQKERELDDLLTRLSLYVENIAAGNETVIAGAGMEVKRPASPPVDLAAPENVEASAGAAEGEMRLRWKPVKGSAAYVVQMATIADENSRAAISWMQAGFSTSARITVNGLVAGMRYLFRVAPIGAKGQGPWSDSASKMAV